MATRTGQPETLREALNDKAWQARKEILEQKATVVAMIEEKAPNADAKQKALDALDEVENAGVEHADIWKNKTAVIGNPKAAMAALMRLPSEMRK